MSDDLDSSVGASSSQSIDTPAEKLIPQSRVEEIVRDRVNQKENRLRNEYEAKINELKSSPPAQSGLTPDDVQKIIAEQQQKMSEELLQYNQTQQMQKTVQSFIDKVKDGSQTYPDFEEKVASLQLDKIPALVHLSDEVDNTKDVIYELSGNPGKIANILSLASNENTVHLARSAIKQISDSIKQNELAKLQHANKPNHPLKPIKQSFAGTDNGVRTVSDLRKMPWMKA